jgi:CBS-domain-containing membrane protein
VSHHAAVSHNAGGATALIACIGSQKLLDLNWLYVLIPVGCGASVMVLVCLIVNNFDPYRSYPQYWW